MPWYVAMSVASNNRLMSMYVCARAARNQTLFEETNRVASVGKASVESLKLVCFCYQRDGQLKLYG
jgi:hypothetical protein